MIQQAQVGIRLFCKLSGITTMRNVNGNDAKLVTHILIYIYCKYPIRSKSYPAVFVSKMGVEDDVTLQVQKSAFDHRQGQ